MAITNWSGKKIKILNNFKYFKTNKAKEARSEVNHVTYITTSNQMRIVSFLSLPTLIHSAQHTSSSRRISLQENCAHRAKNVLLIIYFYFGPIINIICIITVPNLAKLDHNA